ncbi:hypothetical protein EIP86_006110 [Pleurotus ostreatoroseus]|nr:hypothetical protein EIP86_006110 [Pleurotus ostreatoroseus]
MIALSPAAPAHKRPRGLWKGRREAALLPRPDPAARSHAHDDLEHCASTSTYSFDSYYDDLDDDRASSSSYSRPASSKRRRISPADSDTLWHYSPVSRSPSPDPNDDVPCCPAQIADDFLPPAMQFHHKPDPYASINRQDKGQPLPFTSDLEEWESLKALYARAYQSYENDDPAESLPLLRAVIRAAHLFLLAHPDPSVVFVEPPPPRDSRSPELMTPAEERLLRDWAAATEPYDAPRRPSLAHMPSTSSASSLPNGHAHAHNHTHNHTHAHPHPPKKPADPPTAFHALFGTALYLVGTLLLADPGLALPDEPRAPSTYWLAALDVFETGENMPAVVHGARARPEDWRMAVAWGRTLVCLAEEKLRHAHELEGAHGAMPAATTPTPGRDLANGWCAYAPSAGPFSHSEPRWPASSPFHAIAVARPPVTRRMSLWGASAHDVLVLAMDQFARGIFHMPHPHYSASHNPTGLQLEEGVGAMGMGGGMRGPGGVKGPGGGGAFVGRPGGTTPASRLSSLPPAGQDTALPFSRPKELFTIASSLLSVAERLARAAHREYWASQADSVFNQMKMEADMDVSRAAVNAARGRCWLVVGEARAEELEGALERGEGGVLWSAEAEEAREGLGMAITFFDRAKGSAKKRFNYGYGRRGAGEEEGAVGELGPLLAEAIVTLGNLTADEGRREALYVRAQGEVEGDLGLGASDEDAGGEEGEGEDGDEGKGEEAREREGEKERDKEKEKEDEDDAFAAAEAARIIAEAAEAYAREEQAGVANAVGVRVVGGGAVPAPVPVPMPVPTVPMPMPVPTVPVPMPVPTVPVEISMGLGAGVGAGAGAREGGFDGALAGEGEGAAGVGEWEWEWDVAEWDGGLAERDFAERYFSKDQDQVAGDDEEKLGQCDVAEDEAGLEERGLADGADGGLADCNGCDVADDRAVDADVSHFAHDDVRHSYSHSHSHSHDRALCSPENCVQEHVHARARARRVQKHVDVDVDERERERESPGDVQEHVHERACGVQEHVHERARAPRGDKMLGETEARGGRRGGGRGRDAAVAVAGGGGGGGEDGR